jgi:hypothetical protein
MGKLNIGILGGFSGTVGTVVGSTNKKGEDIIRAKSKKRRTANTEGQVIQQTKFGLVTGFMQGVNPLLKTGLKQVASAENMLTHNYACRHALKIAVVGTDAQPELDYSKIIISDGSLSRIAGATATKEGDTIKFSWSDTVSSSIGSANDKVALLVYNVTNGEISYSMGEVLRSAKTATLPIPYSEPSDQLLFYLFFQSATDAALVSTSQYLGTVSVTE